VVKNLGQPRKTENQLKTHRKHYFKTMADVRYTHAGNTDQLKDMQIGNLPRCNMCHYTVGQHTIKGEIQLFKTTLPSGQVLLFCNLCTEPFSKFTDEEKEAALGLMRPLPEAAQKANNYALKLIHMAETARSTAEKAMQPEKVVNGHVLGKGTVCITDKDGNTIVLGSTGAVDFKLKKND
jgi:hypothetical protein